MMRYAFLFLLFTAAFPAMASPPPPPPQYVWDAAKVLVAQTNADPVQLALLFADDLTAFQNGKIVATGKAAWLKWRADSHPGGRVLGFSESFGGYSEGGGELLVVDTFDTVDRSNLPPGFLADPRAATRSTLYQFGTDHLIHFVRISRVGGFWMVPHS